jgi:hypothetical protein
MKDGYIQFEHRSYRFTGDKGSWALIKTDDNGVKTLTIKRSSKGLVSEAYEIELQAFGEKYGIDFSRIHSGNKVTVNI